MPAEIMIECEHLTKRFGHFIAVDGVSFAVAKGLCSQIEAVASSVAVVLE